MILDYKKKFKKTYKKLDIKLRNKVDQKIKLFSQDPFLKELNNHALKWVMKWKRSINITWDYRAIFKEYPNWTYEFVEFFAVWTHSELYK